MGNKASAETIRTIRHKSRRQYNAEEKIRFMLESLREEDTVAELCRREGIGNTLIWYSAKLTLKGQFKVMGTG